MSDQQDRHPNLVAGDFLTGYAARSGAAHRMAISQRSAEYPFVQTVDLRLWTW